VLKARHRTVSVKPEGDGEDGAVLQCARVSIPPEIRKVSGFDALYGLEVLQLTAELVIAQVQVTDRVLQPYGLVHGGVYATIAESLASAGTMVGIYGQGQVAVGLSNQTSFLRPITGGSIHAKAIPKHRGRTTWVWEVELSDDDDHLCALTRMTIAVRNPGQTAG
jgi:1,4-dihydroxy-2-naphthoyl-CoA hydrolase